MSTAVAQLQVASALVRAMERDAERAYPHECCGVMYGRDTSEGRIVEKVEAVENAFEEAEKYHRFSISPAQLMAAEKVAAREGRLVVGFYHSHPDHPARPSEYDRVHGWPFYSYVIVSVAKGEAVDLTSWVMDESTETFGRQDVVEIG